MGKNGYHKLSMDHTKCKNANNIGLNTAEWVSGTCQAAGYDKLVTFGGGFRPMRKEWTRSSGYSAAQLANYKIPSWADPHYSASGNDRNYG